MTDINRAKELLNEITDCKNMEPEKLKLLLPYLDEWINTVQNIKELDLTLQEGIRTALGENSRHVIIKDTEFQDKLNGIGEDSLIIYVKKAQVYKVYNPGIDGSKDNMYSDFVDDDNTKYRTKRNGSNGNVYEVVRDANPQRLLITIAEDISDDKIEHIKRHILEFINKYTKFMETNMNNLKVYGNDNNTEFLVSNIHFRNITERDEFMEEFIKYMRVSKKDAIADKIQVRPPLGTVKGTRLYKVGSQKTSKDSAIIVDSLDHLITYISPSGQTHVTINGPVTIVNGNKNKINISNVLPQQILARKTIQTFCRYIYDTNPVWYEEGNYVDFADIESAYREYFEDNESETFSISKALNGKLFTQSSRKTEDGKRKTMKKLVKKEALKNVK
jgi:septum formation topological specificity factor MinE